MYRIQETPQLNESTNCFVLAVQIFRMCLHTYVVLSCILPSMHSFCITLQKEGY